MQLLDLNSLLKAALMDSAEKLDGMTDGIICLALSDFSRYRPAVCVGSIRLRNNQLIYPGPEGFIRVKTSFYGQQSRARQPWENGYPRNLPRIEHVDSDKGKCVMLSHFPSFDVLGSCGWTLDFSYYRERTIHNGVILIDRNDEPLLLLRCLAESVKYIAINQLSKSVSLRNSIGGEAKNGTPSAIHKQLMDLFLKQIRES